jgi:DNA-binding CsgD family transcriptional regulator
MRGRAGESTELRTTLDGGGSVLVVGPPGIGKSTLVEATLRARPHLQGNCVSGLRWQPYFPLSQATGVQLAGDPEVVASVVHRTAAGRPLVLDDVQWADDATVTALGLLAGRVQLVLTSREVPAAPWAAELTVIQLAPLPPQAARALARQHHPDMGAADVERLVELAAGNPLLLEHLASSSRTTPTLRAAVVARLAELPPEAREVVAELALAGRPVAVGHLGAAADRLPPALVARRDGALSLQHQLLAEATIESLSPRERAEAHLRLAGRVGDVDAAEHFLAAGATDAARGTAERALREGVEPAARAHLLDVVASATGDARSRVDAAAALVAIGNWRAAAAHVTDLVTDDDLVAAEAALQLSRARWFAGDAPGARVAAEAGLVLVDGSGTAMEARLRVDLAHQRVRTQEATRATTAVAREALAVAERVGVDVPRARNVLATALAHDGRDGWEEAYRAVIPEAFAAGDAETACAAAFLLASHLGFAGRLREAIDLLDTMIERAGDLGQLTWRTHMRSAVVTDRFLAGTNPAGLVDDAARFVTEHPVFRNRAQPELVLALSLADTGAFSRARASLRRALDELPSDEDRSILLAGSTEVEWLAGDLRATVKLAEEATQLGGGWFGITAGAMAAAAYARFELDEAVTDEPPAAKVSIFAGFAGEIAALRTWSAGDLQRALCELDAAAAAWLRNGPTRYALRARWAAGVLAGRLGDASARRRLEAVRMEATAAGWVALARRAAAGLALLDPALTDREAAVLRLVGDGLTSAAIAGRLAISRSTVESHVASAMRKLGAHTRRQAASMLDASAVRSEGG